MRFSLNVKSHACAKPQADTMILPSTDLVFGCAERWWSSLRCKTPMNLRSALSLFVILSNQRIKRTMKPPKRPLKLHKTITNPKKLKKIKRDLTTERKTAFSILFGVDLEVRIGRLSSATEAPYLQGPEFFASFGSEFTLDQDDLSDEHVYLAFRWSSASQKVKSVQWQVVHKPSSYGREDWEYPAGIMAKGVIKEPTAKLEDWNYFVVDFRPIINLPKEFTLKRPSKVPVRKVTLIKPVMRATHVKPVRMHSIGRTSALDGILKYLDTNRPYYLRLVIIGENGTPLGISQYVKIRTSNPDEDKEIEIFPDLLGPPKGPEQPERFFPTWDIVSYDPPRYATEEDHYRFIATQDFTVMGQTIWKAGEKVFLKPKRDDKDFWDHIEGAINSIGDLVDWVSSAWSDLQSDLVDGICGGSSDCKALAGPALKGGLMALGIPPELPTSAALASMGKEYVAAYVADQVPGVPPELVDEGIDRMTDYARNPPKGEGAPLFVPDPDFQDRPPCVHVKVHNPHQRVSDPMVIHLDYHNKDGDSVPTVHPEGVSPFNSTNTPVPPLQPNQFLNVPIFLTKNIYATESFSTSYGRCRDNADRRIGIFSFGKLIYTGETAWSGGPPK